MEPGPNPGEAGLAWFGFALCCVAFVVAVVRAAALGHALLAFILAGPHAVAVQTSIAHARAASTRLLKTTAGPCCTPGKGDGLGKAILSAWEASPCHLNPAPELRL